MGLKKGLGSRVRSFFDKSADKVISKLDDKKKAAKDRMGIKVKKVMSRAIFVPPRASKKELLRIIKRHPQVELFIVANKDKKFLGDVHENDLFLMLVPNEVYEEVGLDLAFNLEKKFFAKAAKDLMRKHDVSCQGNDDIMDVAKKFAQVEVNEMPVMNEKNKVVGFVTQGMILRKLKVK